MSRIRRIVPFTETASFLYEVMAALSLCPNEVPGMAYVCGYVATLQSEHVPHVMAYCKKNIFPSISSLTIFCIGVSRTRSVLPLSAHICNKFLPAVTGRSWQDTPDIPAGAMSFVASYRAALASPLPYVLLHPSGIIFGYGRILSPLQRNDSRSHEFLSSAPAS